MDVLFKPPMLYLLLVMISWSVGWVPRLVRQRRHWLVLLTALLHLVVYSVLVHYSVPLEPWDVVVSEACKVSLWLTFGGYLLHSVRQLVEVGVRFPIPGFRSNSGKGNGNC